MRFSWSTLWIFGAVLLAACGEVVDHGDDDLVEYPPALVEKTNTATRVYVHYMPWYLSKERDGAWGSHWTMATRNPDVVEANGRRQIASFYYPLIGPYSSNDPDVIEYHLLLMKLCGVDGVLIDWYGTHPVYDYPDNLRNSNALIDRTDEVGLRFGIVYEDRTTENVVAQGHAMTPVAAAKADFAYMRHTYFGRDNYLRVNGKPLVPIFTPVYLQQEADWLEVVADIHPQPALLSIWEESHDLGRAGSGEYAWVYNGTGNHSARLAAFYGLAGRFEISMGSAYPGFRDYYLQGGWGNSIGWTIEHHGVQTLLQTLNLAAQYRPAHLQLVTWNDFGEGTMLEPTVEFGYTFLEQIQKFTGVSYTVADLEQVRRLYDLRKQHAGNPETQRRLDQAFYYFVSLQIDKAVDVLRRL